MPTARLALVALVASLALALPPAAANFNDDRYHEVVLFNWDTVELDVLVVPPATTSPIPRGIAIERSLDAWESGIRQLGAPWLAEALQFHRYTLGRDTPPAEALQDPEVIIVSAEVNPAVLFGIGAASDYFACEAVDLILDALTAGPGLRAPVGQAAPPLPPGWHGHEGSPWAVMNLHCSETLENVCLVVNTNFAFQSQSQHHMYDLNAHEFGHCLGIGHVGDAGDFKAKRFPREDIMSYQYTPSQVHCVSSLNLRALEGAFAPVLGRPQSEWVGFFEYVHMDPADYVQASCANPY